MREELTKSTEHEQARALLAKVVATGPAQGMDTALLLRTLRRRYIWQRGTVAGVVALSVVAAVSGAMALPGLSRTSQDPVLPAASSDAGKPSWCVVKPAERAADDQGPQPISPVTPAPPCPLPEWTTDDRARALTAALDAAKDGFLPKGTTVTAAFHPEGKPAQKPFEFLKQTYLSDVEYTANAYIGDSRGTGVLEISVRKGNPAVNPTCIEARRPVRVHCEVRTLADGTRAVVDQTHAQFSTDFLETRVDATRPDGTEFHLRCSNVTTRREGDNTADRATRPTAPLEPAAMLKIVEIAGLKY